MIITTILVTTYYLVQIQNKRKNIFFHVMKTLKICCLNTQLCSLRYACCPLLPQHILLFQLKCVPLACGSAAQTLRNPTDCSTPGFPLGYLRVIPPHPHLWELQM